MYKLAHLVKFMNVNEPVVKNVAKINLIKNKPEEEKPDFLEVEEMGIQCPRDVNDVPTAQLALSPLST